MFDDVSMCMCVYIYIYIHTRSLSNNVSGEAKLWQGHTLLLEVHTNLHTSESELHLQLERSNCVCLWDVDPGVEKVRGIFGVDLGSESASQLNSNS